MEQSTTKKQADYGAAFWLHAIFNAAAYISFLLIPWQWIIVGDVLLQAQYIIFKGCVLTKAEFGQEDDKLTCIGYYLQKWGLIKEQTRMVKIWIRYISPIIIIFLAIILQVVLNFKPLLSRLF